RAAGVSVYRIVGWVLQPALIFVLLALVINQFVLPYSNQLAQEINDEDNSSLVTSVRGYWTVQPRFESAKDGSAKPDGSDILYIDYADVQGNIGEVKRWHLDNNGNLQTAIHAEGGKYIGREAIDTNSSKPSEQYRYEWMLNKMNNLMFSQGIECRQYFALN